jgi:hypothetical protein
VTIGIDMFSGGTPEKISIVPALYLILAAWDTGSGLIRIIFYIVEFSIH